MTARSPFFLAQNGEESGLSGPRLGMVRDAALQHGQEYQESWRRSNAG